jgi:hypothetical protein
MKRMETGWGVEPLLKAVLWWWKNGQRKKACKLLATRLLPALWFSLRVRGLEGVIRHREGK